MGVGPKLGVSSSIYDMVRSNNPDPSKYKIIDAMEVDNYLIIKLKYDDCTNYEGMKILVYKDTTAVGLLRQGKIDPHFSDCLTAKHPIARFEPTPEGWRNARLFVQTLALFEDVGND